MKIGIIAANNLRNSPYIFFYTRILDNLGISYEIIYPQRNGVLDKINIKTHEIPWNSHRNNLINYVLYTLKSIQIIKKEKYDFLIVLTTIMSVFLCRFLRKYYLQKYIIDIRDYTYENNFIYYYLEKKALNNSCLNIISSSQFRKFLPNEEYTVCHNISSNKIGNNYWSKAPQDQRIRIGYVGSITYLDQCKKLIDLVVNDPQFEFHFYGTSSQEIILKNYAAHQNCPRIIFHGGYKPEEKIDIINSIDILFNAYGNDSLLLQCALSNKLYDAFFCKKLLITSPNTYMEEFAGIIAYSLDLSIETSLIKLKNWYFSLDEAIVNKYMETMAKKVIQENQIAINKITDAIIKHIGSGTLPQ